MRQTNIAKGKCIPCVDNTIALDNARKILSASDLGPRKPIEDLSKGTAEDQASEPREAAERVLGVVEGLYYEVGSGLGRRSSGSSNAFG